MGQVYALEIEEYMQSFSESAFSDSGFSDRREVLLGSATDSIEKLARRGVRFDIAFLDADKGGYLVRTLGAVVASSRRLASRACAMQTMTLQPAVAICCCVLT